MLYRVRISSFLAGFGICAAFALYQLRQDVLKSHTVIASQADEYKAKLEGRIASLEATLAEMRSAQHQA